LESCDTLLYICVKQKDMEILKISNSCINCDNLNHELKRCGVHEVEVNEKYTCAEFRTDSA